MKYLIAGLGNIGHEYTDTRHNIGFMVVEKIAQAHNVQLELNRHAYTGKFKFRGRNIYLVLPTTYMNLSGKAIRYYLNDLKIDPQQLLVITDDIALPFGRCRLKKKGSDGGHNGLKHIQELLGTTQYPRMRVGIGNDFHRGHQADYVLSPFTAEESQALPNIIDKCVAGIKSFVSIGIDRTMNDFNKKPKPEEG